ncbi:hypothetical protein [Rhodobaculum claviforme]|nr:hypothetical protein [Rhodobaculum claviforme]
MGQVVALCHEEGVRLDPARLRGLVADVGRGAAAGITGLALEEMARRLARMEEHYQGGETRQIRRHALALSRRAGTVGMTSLARVAGDVATCAGRGDMVAFAATWTRLHRITDRSLSALHALRNGHG